jgi:hypothetical protein
VINAGFYANRDGDMIRVAEPTAKYHHPGDSKKALPRCHDVLESMIVRPKPLIKPEIKPEIKPGDPDVTFPDNPFEP